MTQSPYLRTEDAASYAARMLGGIPTVDEADRAALLAGLPVLIVAHALGSTPVRWVGLALMVIGVVGHVIAGAGYAAGMARAHRRAQSSD